MTCIIHWNTLNFSQWEHRFSTIPRANLLQSHAYAKAIAPLNNQKPRWGLTTINGTEAGLVQILEAGIAGNMLHAVILDRGPLWFEGFGTPEHIEAFLAAYNKQFRGRLGRKRRIILEAQNSPEMRESLTRHGFKNKNGSEFQTYWLDIRPPPETLRENLKKNWRGTLSKAEKQNLTIEWDDQGRLFSWLMNHYPQDRAQKGYDGPSVKLLNALAKTFTPGGNMLIARAQENGKDIAGILILCHGSAATYQVGFTTNAGRTKGAHHILLWNAILVLQQKGIKDFDLGGVNDETAKGVKDFKTGMGGALFVSPGLYS